MKRIIFLAVLLGYTGADVHAELPATIYGDAWKDACQVVAGGCTGVPSPKIVWFDKMTDMREGEGEFRAGYDGSATVYLSVALEEEEIYGTLIHEYAHHIMHHNGESVIRSGNVRAFCRSEKKAYYFSNAWLKDNGFKHLRVRNWKKYYPQCS